MKFLVLHGTLVKRKDNGRYLFLEEEHDGIEFYLKLTESPSPVLLVGERSDQTIQMAHSMKIDVDVSLASLKADKPL
jgi:hypothetical protein